LELPAVARAPRPGPLGPRSIRGVLAWSIPAVALTALIEIAPARVLSLTFGGGYADATGPLRTIAVSMLLAGLSLAAVQVLLAAGRISWVSWGATKRVPVGGLVPPHRPAVRPRRGGGRAERSAVLLAPVLQPPRGRAGPSPPPGAVAHGVPGAHGPDRVVDRVPPGAGPVRAGLLRHRVGRDPGRPGKPGRGPRARVRGPQWGPAVR